MINLMPPLVRQDLKAARVNVMLVRYVVMLFVLTLAISLIYGAGFWIAHQEKRTMLARLEDQNMKAKQYSKVRKEAQDYRDNLRFAKQIIDKGIPYSKFLTILAQDIPDGTVMSALVLGTPKAVVPGVNASTVDMRARTSSEEKAVQLKNSLEQSKLFENVRINNISRPDSLEGLQSMESRYPYEVALTATLSNVDYTRESAQ